VIERKLKNLPNPTTVKESPDLQFKRIWSKTFPSPKKVSFSSNGSVAAIFDESGTITVVNVKGDIEYTLRPGEAIRSLSISNDCQILLVVETGHVVLVNPRGEMVWKKRPFQAILGVISPSGKHFAFVTKEPTIAFTDDSCKPKWQFRNLLSVPTFLRISNKEDFVCFSGAFEKGQAIFSVSQAGRANAPFRINSQVNDLAINKTDTFCYAIDKGNYLYSIDLVQGVAFWKEALNHEFHKIAVSRDPERLFLFSSDGTFRLLNVDGAQIFEGTGRLPLAGAGIGSDSQSLFFVFESGETEVLRSLSPRDLSAKKYEEVSAPIEPSLHGDLTKVWSVELPLADEGNKPLVKFWEACGSEENILIWDGLNSLVCLTHEGEEVWKNRISGGKAIDLSVSGKSDLSILITTQGILGTKMIGTETFRWFGNFRKVHVFDSGAFIFLTEKGEVPFYLKKNLFLHIVPLEEPIFSFEGMRDFSFLIGKKNIFVVDRKGEKIGNYQLFSEVSFHSAFSKDSMIFGTNLGEVIIIGKDCKPKYKNHVGTRICLASYDDVKDVLFVVEEGSPGALIFDNSNNRKIRVPFKENFQRCARTSHGIVFSTKLDELVLIDFSGAVLTRYSFPDKILDLFPTQSGSEFFVLAENSFTRLEISIVTQS